MSCEIYVYNIKSCNQFNKQPSSDIARSCLIVIMTKNVAFGIVILLNVTL